MSDHSSQLLRISPKILNAPPRTSLLGPKSVTPAPLECLPAELLQIVVQQCGIISRANLARTNKNLARLMVSGNHLEFWYNLWMLSPGPSFHDRLPAGVDFTCTDLDFLMYSHMHTQSAEEVDATDTHIIQVLNGESQIVCTYCGWRDHHPYGQNNAWDRHMKMEMTRLGVVYSHGVRTFIKGAATQMYLEAKEIEEEDKPVLQALKDKFSDFGLIKSSWNKFKVNQMLHRWDKQDKAGKNLTTWFQASESKWKRQ